jgi:hypothetical protein
MPATAAIQIPRCPSGADGVKKGKVEKTTNWAQDCDTSPLSPRGSGDQKDGDDQPKDGKSKPAAVFVFRLA